MKTDNFVKSIQRKNALKDGFYDGRFKTKIVKDKKKEFSKKECRSFKYSW